MWYWWNTNSVLLKSTHFWFFLEGKEMRHDLIEELRTTHTLQPLEQKQKRMEAEAIRAKQSLDQTAAQGVLVLENVFHYTL